MAEIESNLNERTLGELIVRQVYFPRAGEEVEVTLPGNYAIAVIPPNGEYRAKVVKGDRRATIRKGSSTWTWENVYFVSDTAGVYADVAIGF